jgi:hypothetical protein
MGSRDQLPDHQLNVAMGGASSSSMPAQARELVRRLSILKEVDVYNTWLVSLYDTDTLYKQSNRYLICRSLILATIGTEEI